MRDQRRNPAGTARFSTTADAGVQGALERARQAPLARLAGAVGNEGMKGRLDDATRERDALVGFVGQRLAELRSCQLAEARAMGAERRWFDEVGRGRAGFGLPDPTRWRAPAALYRRALEALAMGNLARAGDFVDQAVEAERAAFRSVPEQVELPEAAQAPERPPDERPFVTAGAAAPAVQHPELLAEARAIEAWTDRSEKVETPREVPGTWFDQEPEAAAEGADGKKDEKKDEKKEAPKAAPAIAAAPAKDEAKKKGRKPA